MTISPKIPLVAAIVAFAWAGLTVFYALTELIIYLIGAVIPLAAGIGILRRRVWAAYGLALYLTGGLLLTPFIVIRSGALSAVPLEMAVTLVVSILLSLIAAVLFFLAGRSLAKTGARRGWAAPWIALTAACTIPMLFVQPFVIPTGAMEDTLLIGDHILVQRFPAPSVMREDIIVFTYPVDRRQRFVKRVIGMPGDRIRISDKVVYLNGTALNEPYAVHRTPYTDAYRDNFPSEPNGPGADKAQDMLDHHVVNGEVVVPERSYFVLGDNRDLSLDSRYWGFVSVNDLVGEPLFVYHSEEKPPAAEHDGEDAAPRQVRWERFLKVL